MTVYNTEYAQSEFLVHGETWIQSRFAGKFNTIFDVGCNIGEWTRMARSFHPNAEIHMFEIAPDTYSQMLKNIPIDNKIIPNSFGLSDTIGTVPLKYKPSYNALTTTVTDLQLDDSITIQGLTFTGDDYVESRRIQQIDYLKIDTEGAESRVFKGFEKTLRAGKIKVLQFEYGYICVLTKWLLMDSYKYLEPLGFKLGKLCNGHIEFHDYTLIHEDFKGPDYVAVHESVWKDFGL